MSNRAPELIDRPACHRLLLPLVVGPVMLEVCHGERGRIRSRFVDIAARGAATGVRSFSAMLRIEGSRYV